MRKWLARKLFDLAVRLDWEEATIVAKAITMANFMATLEHSLKASPKPGRPLGSKNKKPRKPRVKS